MASTQACSNKGTNPSFTIHPQFFHHWYSKWSSMSSNRQADTVDPNVSSTLPAPFLNVGEANGDLNSLGNHHRSSLAMPRKAPQPPWSSASFLVARLPAGHNLDLPGPGQSAAMTTGVYPIWRPWYLFLFCNEGVKLEHLIAARTGTWTPPLGLPIWHQS